MVEKLNVGDARDGAIVNDDTLVLYSSDIDTEIAVVRDEDHDIRNDVGRPVASRHETSDVLRPDSSNVDVDLSIIHDIPADDGNDDSDTDVASDIGDKDITNRSTFNCSVCHEGPPKYKCSKCRMFYCDTVCFKAHQDGLCPGVTPQSGSQSAPAPPIDLLQESAASLDPSPLNPSNPWSVLSHSEALRLLYIKYPNLPNLLFDIASASDPPSATTGDGSGRTRAWDSDVGRGFSLELMCALREGEDVDGEALREYCELIRAITGRVGRQAVTTANSSNPAGPT